MGVAPPRMSDDPARIGVSLGLPRSRSASPKPMTRTMHTPSSSSPPESCATTRRRIASRLRTRGRAALVPAGALFVVLGCVAPAPASAYGPSTPVITDYAGIANVQALPTPGLATSSHLDYPQSVTVDPSGDLYIVDP